MKNKKILWTALPFLAGAIFGISLLGLLSFTGQSTSPGPNSVIAKVSVDVAHAYAQKYLKNATPYTLKMKGFTVDLAELTIMNSILAADPSAEGFRFYFGTDASGTGLLIICGVDAKGSDMTGTIFSATTNNVGPCPPVCDAGSPISGQ
jgi:hypothetical protein